MANASDTKRTGRRSDPQSVAGRRIIREAAQRFEDVSREIAEKAGVEPVQRPAGGGSGGDDVLNDLLEREAEQFSAAAARAAALAGAAVEAAKAGNDRIEENNARLKATLAAFENRG